MIEIRSEKQREIEITVPQIRDINCERKNKAATKRARKKKE
jgi:hypothetical protein